MRHCLDGRAFQYSLIMTDDFLDFRHCCMFIAVAQGIQFVPITEGWGVGR